MLWLISKNFLDPTRCGAHWIECSGDQAQFRSTRVWRNPALGLLPSRPLIKPLMEGRSLGWALGQCDKIKKRNREAVKNLLRAFAPYAQEKSVQWFRSFPREPYPIGQDVYIPLNPNGFWAEEGRLTLLWVQPWKMRTLDQRQKAIFRTIFEERIFVGDFKDARLEWVDLREQEEGKGRERVIRSAGFWIADCRRIEGIFGYIVCSV